MYMEEIWLPINGYENLYHISNMGKVKSLAKSWYSGTGNIGLHHKSVTIITGGIDSGGYRLVNLYKDNKKISKRIHSLMWDAFRNESYNSKQIDHKDENKLNNRIDNLQLLTQRQNSSKSYLLKSKTSKYTGVSWKKDNNKWLADIRMNGEKKYLGLFNCETAAMVIYEKTLLNLIRKEINIATL